MPPTVSVRDLNLDTGSLEDKSVRLSMEDVLFQKIVLMLDSTREDPEW